MHIEHSLTPFLFHISERTLYMKFPFFASFLIFIAVLHYNMNKGNKSNKQQEDAFWKRELDANHIRRQSLDDLNYIPFQAEPFYPVTLLGPQNSSSFFQHNPTVKDMISRLLFLESQKIVNLNAYSNTDLKYKYGVANLNLLSEYDSNFSELITLLHDYGSLLAKDGYEIQALQILEYAISIGSDISSTYTLCADIYKKHQQDHKLIWLKKEAEKISTSRKDTIVRKLQISDL